LIHNQITVVEGIDHKVIDGIFWKIVVLYIFGNSTPDLVVVLVLPLVQGVRDGRYALLEVPEVRSLLYLTRTSSARW
jgi:hypothetical protein